LPVNKSKLNSIYLRARATFNSPNVTFDLIDRIIESDFTEEFNPITEYINKNRHRNKDGQLLTLIHTIHSDTINHHIFIRKWMLSLIAAYEGNPVRSVLSLVGGQGTGKTEWFRRILPKDLQKYYAESKLDAGKDDDLLMCQKLIVVDDEMGGKSKQDEKRFKELTSKQVFSLREAYGRGNQDYKRLAVLGGTSNDHNIINDPTGNTRILPVNVLSIDHNLFNSIDKDELFMECYRQYKAGEDWYLSKSEFNDLSALTPEFEGIAFERELILSKFSTSGFLERWLTATAIKNEIEMHSKQQIKNMKIFGAELKRIFGDSMSKKVNGNPQKLYRVYDNNGQMADNQHNEPF
jgi:predicted P-loop ATPase